MSNYVVLPLQKFKSSGLSSYVHQFKASLLKSLTQNSDSCDMKHSVVLSLPLSRQSSYLASFPGPAQLSIACSTEKFFIRAQGEPGNEASSYLLGGDFSGFSLTVEQLTAACDLPQTGKC